MTYEDLMDYFSDNGLDIQKERYKTGLRCKQCGEQFVCNPKENIYLRFVKDDVDNERLAKVYETEEECVAEMATHIYNHLRRYPINGVKKEEFEKFMIEANIDAFAKWVNMYSKVIGFKYVQYNSEKDYFNEIGECGIVIDNTKFKKYTFVYQERPAEGDRPDFYLHGHDYSTIFELVKVEKMRMKNKCLKCLACGKRWTIKFDKLTNKIVYIYGSEGKKGYLDLQSKAYKCYISQHPEKPILYIDDYGKIEKTISVDGFRLPKYLDSPECEWKELGKDLYTFLVSNKIIKCPACGHRWLVKRSKKVDKETQEIVCDKCNMRVK